MPSGLTLILPWPLGSVRLGVAVKPFVTSNP